MFGSIQLIKGVNALGSTMVNPIQVEYLAKGYNEDHWFKDEVIFEPMIFIICQHQECRVKYNVL
jgi:hypothetical protein